MMEPMGDDEEDHIILPNFSNWMSSTTAFAEDISSDDDDESIVHDMSKFDIADDSDDDGPNGDGNSNNSSNSSISNSISNLVKNRRMQVFADEGMVVGQGHRHGSVVYDDWGLPISNPSNFREGRNMCRPWLVSLNLLAVSLVIAIIIRGGPTSDYEYHRSNGYGQEMDIPDTTWDVLGDELVGPIPNRFEAENRLVGFGHHVVMNENGDRIAVARTKGSGNSPGGEVFVYSWKGRPKHKHNRPRSLGKWRLEQVLTAQLSDDDMRMFHTAQHHTPLAMSASGHRIAFTEGDHVFIFEKSTDKSLAWVQIAKAQALHHDLNEGTETEHIKPALEASMEDQEQNQDDGKTTSQPDKLDEQATVSTVTQATIAPATEKQDNAAADDDDDDDDDDYDAEDDDSIQDEEEKTRKLQKESDKEDDNHFGRHLAFSHDGKTLAVMGYSRTNGGYIRIFHDETEDVRTENSDIMPGHIFEPTPDIFLEEAGDSMAFSGDGQTLAVGAATSDAMDEKGTHKGLVQIFKISEYSNEWSRIGQPLFGEYAMEGFGGSLSLSENGLVLAVGVAFGGGPVKIFELAELDHAHHQFIWKQRGQTLAGSNHREQFGTQVRLNYDGKFVAIGAPGSPDMLELDEPIEDNMLQYLHGKAYLFEYSDQGNAWVDAGHATSTYEGDAFGYSLAVSGDGGRVLVSAPFRIVENELNVGIAQVFGDEDVLNK